MAEQIKPTYTYQGNLNMVIGKALEFLIAEENYRAYRALEVCYRFLVPKVKKDLREYHNSLAEKIHNTRSKLGVDIYDTNTVRSKSFERLIDAEVSDYLEHLVEALDKHRLLIEEWGAKPKFGSSGKI